MASAIPSACGVRHPPAPRRRPRALPGRRLMLRGPLARRVGPGPADPAPALTNGVRPHVLRAPDAVLLHDAAVELDPAALPQVLHDVPVDVRLVAAAEVGEARSEGDVDGAVDLLVEVDVADVAVDAGVAADAELADAARAGVGVERVQQVRLLGLGRRVDDDAALEAEPHPAQPAAAAHRLELREGDRALGGVLDGAQEELAAGHVPEA